MATIQQSIDINVPVHIAYDQLMHFEEYPRFMEGVEEVRQLDDTHLHWHTRTASQDMQWDAEITEQVPDRCIAWRNTSGPKNVGKVELQPTDDGKTRMTLQMDVDPRQQVRPDQAHLDPLDAVAQRTGQDLARFKKFIETRGGAAAGAQRRPDVQSPAMMSGSADRQDLEQPMVAEEQSFDQQSPQARRVGRMPENESGMQDVPGQQTPAEAVAQSMKPQPQAQPAEPPQSTQAQQSWLPSLLHAWEEPLAMMRRMTEEMDRIFEQFVGRPMADAKARSTMGSAWSPALEIKQRGDRLLIEAELPGIKREDVHVEIRNDRLIIEGERREEKQTGEGYRRTERSYGRFYRVVALPGGVDADAASASMRDGMLVVALPVSRQGERGKSLDIRTPE